MFSGQPQKQVPSGSPENMFFLFLFFCFFCFFVFLVFSKVLAFLFEIVGFLEFLLVLGFMLCFDLCFIGVGAMLR